MCSYMFLEIVCTHDKITILYNFYVFYFYLKLTYLLNCFIINQEKEKSLIKLKKKKTSTFLLLTKNTMQIYRLSKKEGAF